MKLQPHHTKIVCTLGPATTTPAMVEKLIRAGMNVARINLAHARLDEHRKTVRMVRATAKKLDRYVAIFADLPGPKMRIGRMEDNRVHLQRDGIVRLVPDDKIIGTADVIPCQYKTLADSLKPGSIVFLNDGFIQLKVKSVQGRDVLCKVLVGGPLQSFKGMNLPGAKIDLQAFTPFDQKALKFMLDEGVHCFGVSFVQTANDIRRVRRAVERIKKEAFLIAKIERQSAVDNAEGILEEADGLMVARGDLGVEIPMEKVPIVQKELIQMANLCGKPVITATQMLESMIDNIRPTRAEITDVANAILDGTDAIMLSGETAVGRYPEETVKTMVSIAQAAEEKRDEHGSHEKIRNYWKRDHRFGSAQVRDMISLQSVEVLRTVDIGYLLAPTNSGNTARLISRFKPKVWIVAFTPNKWVLSQLQFSCGVHPVLMSSERGRWDAKVVRYLRENKLVKKGEHLLLTEGIRLEEQTGTNSLRVITLS